MSHPLEETEIPVELRLPITKLNEETDAHNSNKEWTELQLNTQQTDCWVPGGRMLACTDQMLEHENHKTMRSHAQLFSVSKARTLVIFVDFVVLSLGRISKARETSEVPKMIGICLTAEMLKRCVQFTDKVREMEAKIDARKVLVEEAVTWISRIDLYGKRDPSVKGKRQSEQELSFDWFTVLSD